MDSNTRLVYSTETDGICPVCKKPLRKCACKKARKSAPAPSDGVIRVSRQTKGRKGKGVSLVTGLPLDSEGLKALAKKLKQRCGTGGSLKNGVLEIQGDPRDTLVEALKEEGFSAKKAGG